MRAIVLWIKEAPRAWIGEARQDSYFCQLRHFDTPERLLRMEKGPVANGDVEKLPRRLTTVAIDRSALAGIQAWLRAQRCELRARTAAEETTASSMAVECILARSSHDDRDLLLIQSRASRELPPVIYIVGEQEVEHAIYLLKHGAMDVLNEGHSSLRLAEAIDRAWSYSAAVMANHFNCSRLRERLTRLTGRERAVLRLLLQGQLNKQVAGELSISESTIKAHRRNILSKAGAQTLVGLARCLADAGIGPGTLEEQLDSANQDLVQ